MSLISGFIFWLIATPFYKELQFNALFYETLDTWNTMKMYVILGYYFKMACPNLSTGYCFNHIGMAMMWYVRATIMEERVEEFGVLSKHVTSSNSHTHTGYQRFKHYNTLIG
jgi:hypothetical protein